VALLALTACVSVALAVGGAMAVVHHLEQEKQRLKQEADDTYAHVQLTTQGPPLVVEIFDANGTPVTKVAVPTAQSVALWPGDYAMRVREPWKGVETIPFTVTAGERVTLQVVVSSELMFTTDGPPLVGEIQNGAGEPIVPPFPIPTERPVHVPMGWWFLKLRGPWLPVRSELLQVGAGDRRTVELKLVGRLSVGSNGPPLTGEVLDPKGERIVPAFTLPTPDPVALPPGEHTLRLTGPGLWTETYGLTLNRGDRQRHTLTLSDRTFGPPVRVRNQVGAHESVGAAWVLPGANGPDLLTLGDDGLRRTRWATGRQLWSTVPTHPDMEASSFLGGSEGQRWLRLFNTYRPPGDTAPRPRPVRMLEPAPDLDGDGEPDLVFVSRVATWVLAVSGKTGKVLWCYELVPPPPSALVGGKWKWTSLAVAATMGEPVAADVDGDGTPDVILAGRVNEMSWEHRETKEKANATGGTWVEALSGKTGRPLWRTWLEEDADPQTGPRAFGSHLLQLDGRPALAVLAGRSAGAFDVATGKIVRGPFRLDFDPVGVPKVRPGKNPLFLVGRQREGGDELVAFSALDGRVLWSHQLGFTWREAPNPTGWEPAIRHHPYASAHDWPELVDLDGDGTLEVLVPVPHPARANPENRAGGVLALDGVTGMARWTFWFDWPHVGAGVGYCRLRAIPDVNGDGKPDVAVARVQWTDPSLGPVRPPPEVEVAVISGSDGKPIWRWARPAPSVLPVDGKVTDLGRLATWAPGRDGKPQLVVPVFPVGADTADVLLFDSSTGRLDRQLEQFGEPTVLDLDGDGIPDLFGQQPGPWIGPVPKPTDRTLSAIRGACPEMWRRTECPPPAPDLDGDGVPDLLGPDGEGGLIARSGATGRVLWQSSVSGTLFAQLEDLNGDGTPDILVLSPRHQPDPNGKPPPQDRVVALSGRTGEVLWERPGLLGTFGGAPVPFDSLTLRAIRLRENEPPVAVGLGWVRREERIQFCAFALAGADGRVLWQTAVGPPGNAKGAAIGVPAVADLDGDGTRDLVFWAGPGRLVALCGSTGRPLWERAVEGTTINIGPQNHYFRDPWWERRNPPLSAPAVAVFGGAPAVAIVHRHAERDRVVVLNGRDGTERFAWDGPPGRTRPDWGPQDALTPPRFVRLAGGTFLLAVGLGFQPSDTPSTSYPTVVHRLALLDATGKVHQERSVPGWRLSPDSIVLDAFPIWVADLDGDGFDEVSWAPLYERKFVVARGGIKDEVWSVPVGWPDGVLAVRPGAGGKPGAVVLRTGEFVRGYNGKTGKPVWACAGPGTGEYLPPPTPGELPLVLFTAPEHGVLARRALPVGPDGKFLAVTRKPK
jgi:outer membrane protein assembly factor BamB